MDMEYEQRLAEMRGELELLKAQMQELLDAAEEPRIDTRAAVEPVERPFTVAEQVVNDADAKAVGVAAPQSVETSATSGLQQLHGFDALDGKKTVAQLQAATLRDFVLRFDQPGGVAMVAYADGESVAGYVLPQDTVTKWDVYYVTATRKLVQYQAKWDVATRSWVKDEVTAPVEIAEIPTVPAADGLPDGTWIWGRVAYDATYNKFVQYKLVWSAATRTFTESATAEDIIALDSHASQHI